MEQTIIEKLDALKVDYITNVPLTSKTWIHRGPIVPLYIQPSTTEQMLSLINLLAVEGLSFKVVGHTSNLYIMDTYKVDAFITTSKMTKVVESEDYIICDAGVNVTRFSKDAVEKGYKGFEGLVGLPGTIGGAIVNNSSCFDCSISSLIKEVYVLMNNNGDYKLSTLSYDDLEFTHRNSAFKSGRKNGIILSAKLKKNSVSDIDALKAQAERNVEIRNTTQEGKAMNLGSMFSSLKTNPLKLMSLGFSKVPEVFIFKVREHFLRNKQSYTSKRNRYLLKLWGYEDLINYVSDKNINTFIWRDANADVVFPRYIEFMNKHAKCEKLEIEILN